MTTPPDTANTLMRWHVRTAGHRDTHDGALARDGRVVVLCGASFTPQPGLFEPRTAVAAVTGRPGAVLPHLPDHQHPPAQRDPH